MKLLLDTDTCIDLLRGVVEVVKRAQDFAPDDLAVSAVTRYELFYGVARCPETRRDRERQKVGQFLDVVHELPFTARTAGYAAGVRYTLEKKGTTIGPLDMLIAATALEAELELITGNLPEFLRVPNLACSSWRLS